MKSIISFWTIIFLSFLVASQAIAQQDGAGVEIVSGTKSIYNHPGILDRIADEVYLRNYESFSHTAIAEFKGQVKNATGQATRAENFTLSTFPYFELSEEQGKLLLKYKLNYNKVNFRLTTPDIAFGIGTGRGADPEYDLSWDMAFVYEILTNGNLAQLDVFFKGIELSEQKLNDMSLLNNILIEAYTGAYLPKGDFKDWSGFGFRNYLFKITAIPALQIKDGLQQYLNDKIRLNKDLLEEMKIDGTNTLNLKYDLSAKTLIFEHPYSPSGIVYRTSNEKIRDANINNSLPPTTVPVSENASTIKEKPRSSGTNTSKPVIKKKIEIP